MAVYTDGTHLVADTLDELHAFAEKVGRKRCWFDADTKSPLEYQHPHYDLHGRNQQMYSHNHYWAKRVIEHGAIKTSMYDIPGISNRCAVLRAEAKKNKQPPSLF